MIRLPALAIDPRYIRSREAEVVLSKEVKYRLHLPRMSSSLQRSFPSSSLIYCALPTFLPCNLHPPLICPYQPFMFLALVNSMSLQAYTSRYLYSAACMISLNFLHAFRNARKEEPPAKAPRTTVRAFSLFVQASSTRCALPYPRTTQINGTVRFGLASAPLQTTGVCR